MHRVPWVKRICFQETPPRSWGPYKAPALPRTSGMPLAGETSTGTADASREKAVHELHPSLFQRAPARLGGLFWASDVATSRTHLLVCAEESQGLALPRELQVRTPKLGCLQCSRVVRLAQGRHTELPAVEPGAVHARNNSNKSQRQARPACVRAQGMHPCCPATTTATATSAAAAMPAGCRGERGTCSKCCSSPLSSDPLQTAPASTRTSRELAVHCFPLSCLLFATAPLRLAGRQENTFLQLSQPPQQTLNQ